MSKIINVVKEVSLRIPTPTIFTFGTVGYDTQINLSLTFSTTLRSIVASRSNQEGWRGVVAGDPIARLDGAVVSLEVKNLLVYAGVGSTPVTYEGMGGTVAKQQHWAAALKNASIPIIGQS